VAAEDRGAAVIEAPPGAERAERGERVADPGPGEVAPAGRRRLLFVQSGCVASAVRAVERLGEREPGAPAVTYLTHDAGLVPPAALLPERTEILVARRDGRFFWDLYRQVAAGRYDRVVVLFTGEPGYRRFKLFAVSLCWRPVLFFDRRGECFELGPRGLFRFWRRRLAGRVRRARPEPPAPARPQQRPADPEESEQVPALRLPRAERPAISVVVPVTGGPAGAVECLRSILEGSAGVAYEVVLASDASPAATAALPSRFENARATRFPAGSGIAAAWNAGAAEARGDRLLFLSPEVVPAPDCLAVLERTLDAGPDRGAVGPRVLAPGGRLLEAGGIVWRDGATRAVGAGGDPEAPEFSYLRETDYGSSEALLVRRSLFERIGGFDRRFGGAAAVADLCFGLRALGCSVVTEPRATVVRPGGAAAAPAGPARAREQRAEATALRRKWRRALRRQLDPGPRADFVAADRRRDRIVLVIDHYVPTHDMDAGSYVMFQVLMTLSRLGYRVILWPDNLYRLPRYTEGLQAAGIEVIYGNLDFEEFLAGCSRFLTGILIHRAPMASKYLPRIGAGGPRLFYLCADLEHLREERRAALDGGSSARIQTLFERELEILRRVDRAAVHSPVERELLARLFPGKPIGVVPLPVRPGGLDGLDFDERRGLLFVGSTHPPNVDAVDHYAGRLAPRIARRLPGVQLTVVGEAGKVAAERLGPAANGCLRLAGFVPAIEEYYRSTRVFVAPLRYGAGVKGKILEAMSHGLPVVTTSVGAEGIPIVPGVDAFVADDEEGFADAVAKLYRCRETWEAMRANARKLIEEHYSEHAFEAGLRALIGG